MDARGCSSLRAVDLYAHLEKNQVDDMVRNVTTTVDVALLENCTPVAHSGGSLKVIDG